MQEPKPACWLSERAVGGSVIVELSGEIDALVAPRLSWYLDCLTDRERPDVVLDLRHVSFIDCSGLSPLVRARRRAAERSGRLRIVCDDPRTLRTFRVTELSRHFDILAEFP